MHIKVAQNGGKTLIITHEHSGVEMILGGCQKMITLKEACEVFLKKEGFKYIGSISDIGEAWAFAPLDDNGHILFLGPVLTLVNKNDGSTTYWSIFDNIDIYKKSINIEVPAEYAFDGRTKWWEYEFESGLH